MAKKNVPEDVRTSGDFSPKDWKVLRRQIMDDFLCPEKWGAAYDKFFLHRINTRFLNPARLIARNTGSHKSGEGFTITAILCILIEYLQAYYEGCVYTTSDAPNLYEYNRSRALFVNFLTGHAPFKADFSKKDAERFYDDVRCGLLHEAATKGDAKIKALGASALLQKGVDGFVINRDALLTALEEYIRRYQEVLFADAALRINFLRKIDELNGVGRVQYFAYGSNLLKEQFEVERGVFVHTSQIARLSDFKLVFNKKSTVDRSVSFANLAAKQGETTWGVLYEIDIDDFERLGRVDERGYNRKDICVGIEARQCRAVTFISSSLCDAVPSRNYVGRIIRGAAEKGLPRDYIEKIRQESGTYR